MNKPLSLIKLPKKTKPYIFALLAILSFMFLYYPAQIVQLFNPIKHNVFETVNSQGNLIVNLQQSSTANLPLKLNIPAINIDANIQYVGLTPDGLMDTPSNYTDVAWYQLGVAPGEIGSAVIAGHFGTTNSIFNNLSKLKIGDELKIINNQDKTISFIVNKIEIYNANDNAEQIFFSSDNLAHLNLITCYGIWNKATNRYQSRLVIFADIE